MSFFSQTGLVFLTIVLFVFIVQVVESSNASPPLLSYQQQLHQPCEVSVNKRAYRADKRLYTHKQYEVTFGLPYEASNPPIMYSLDADCRNLSKLRMAFSFDVKDMPVEVNVMNCSKNMNFLHVLESNLPPKKTGAPIKSSYLTFLVDFRSLKIQTWSTLKLNVNRRLGKGCSTTLTFVKTDQTGSGSIFDHDYYDGTSLWTKLGDLVLAYARMATNPPVLLSILVGVLLVLAAVLLLAMTCMTRRRSFHMSPTSGTGAGGFKRPSLVVKWKTNMTKRLNFASSKHRQRNTAATDRQVIVERENSSTASSPIVASCPSFADLEHDRQFQALREQLMNK